MGINKTKYKEQVDFLLDFYRFSLPDHTNIVRAQASGNADCIEQYLEWAKRDIEGLIQRLREEKKGND